MGGLRFSPRVKDSLMRRSSLYLQGDFIRGLDGKMRYFRPQRTVLYRTVLGYLKRYVPEEKVYLCMENRDVWRDVWGIDGMTSAKLSQRLDNACMNVFTSLQRGKPYNPDADLYHPNVSLTNCGE
jgi:spore photoproduct lyase